MDAAFCGVVTEKREACFVTLRSAMRVGERRSGDKRARMCGNQSGMFVSRDAPHSFHESCPRLPLPSQHASPFSRNLVEPVPPHLRLLDPDSLDPSSLLEAIEQGIEGIDVKRQPPARTRVDQFTQLIAVPVRRAGSG